MVYNSLIEESDIRGHSLYISFVDLSTKNRKNKKEEDTNKKDFISNFFRVPRVSGNG